MPTLDQKRTTQSKRKINAAIERPDQAAHERAMACRYSTAQSEEAL
jgi:hypothetical protein